MLARHPDYRRWLTPLLSLFDVTWASTYRAFNADAVVVFLKPELHTARSFGLEREVALIYTSYTTYEPRQVQLAGEFMSQIPARGRVEPVFFVAVSEDPDVREHVGTATSSSVESKTIVPFVRAELERMDEWQVRNEFASRLFSRDLFDISQALVEDTYFFGRQQLVHDLLDRSKHGQNTGLFGLRKTGKTSMVRKLGRALDRNADGVQVVLDAQDPAVYRQRWWELLGTIVEVTRATGTGKTRAPGDAYSGPDSAARAFPVDLERVVSECCGTPRLLLVVDEFEHLCPDLSMSHHWEQDFVPF